MSNNCQMTAETNEKEAFARALLRFPGDPFKAGLVAFGGDAGKAMYAVNNSWATDLEVGNAVNIILEEEGEDAAIPLNRIQWLHRLADMSVEPGSSLADRTKVLEVYGRATGIITEKGVTITNNNNTQNNDNRVIVVVDNGTDDQWSEGLRAQQEALTNG